MEQALGKLARLRVRVAEKKRELCFSGRAKTTLFTSLMKPMSSILSISSRTKNSTPFSLMVDQVQEPARSGDQ